MPAHPLSLLLLFLTLLVFLPPSHGACQRASSTECHKTRFVPGHNLVGEGFNIVKMVTTGALVVDVNTYGNTCTLCYNSLLRQKQKLPASVVDWRIKVNCKRRVSTRSFASSTAVLKENSKSTGTSWKAGLAVEGKGSFAMAGTHSKSSLFAMEHSRKDHFSYISQLFKCEYYIFRLHSKPPLSKDFEAALKRLPISQSPNHVAYKHFFDVYGTHFIHKLKLGGYVKSITAMHTCKSAIKGVSAWDIRDCLSGEAKSTIKETQSSYTARWCNKLSRKYLKGAAFANIFHDRITDILGGIRVSDVLFNSGTNYERWLQSVKRVPGVVSYELTPLHMLVRNNPKLKSKLLEGIKAYIKRSTVPLTCARSCSHGRRDRTCVCTACSSRDGLDSKCCPRKWGMAKIILIVHNARGLGADDFTASDTFVIAKYGKKQMRTRLIDSSDYPTFNKRMEWPNVNLLKKEYLYVQMWDVDNGYDDDLLGNFRIPVPNAGIPARKNEYGLTSGRLYMTLSVQCMPKLTGPRCTELAREPETSSSRRWGLALATSALPEGTLTSHNNTFL